MKTRPVNYTQIIWNNSKNMELNCGGCLYKRYESI